MIDICKGKPELTVRKVDGCDEYWVSYNGGEDIGISEYFKSRGEMKEFVSAYEKKPTSEIILNHIKTLQDILFFMDDAHIHPNDYSVGMMTDHCRKLVRDRLHLKEEN